MANNKENAVNSYRYERKFLVSELSDSEIKSLVKHHQAGFKEVYYQRYVNNIYLNTFNMKAYIDNLEGVSDRIKIRIRWYGALFGQIENPILEIKIKRGLLGTKKAYPLNGFFLNENFNAQRLESLFRESKIDPALKSHLLSVRPTLLNRYSRSYYLSADSKYRITIDNEMDFYHINGCHNSFLHKHRDFCNTVVELKYNEQDDNLAHHIASQFPFRISKNSKFFNGVEGLAL